MKAALCVLFGFLAVLSMGYGALNIMAGGMSDSIEAGREAGAQGLWFGGSGFVVLLIVIGAAIWA